MQITTVGLDIAKNLFQMHGADAQGRVLLKRKLARGKVLEFSRPCRLAWWAWRPAARPTTGLVS